VEQASSTEWSDQAKEAMIHLDANILMRLSVAGSTAAVRLREWLLAGEMLAASAPAWFEYISGPVTVQEIAHAEAVLQGGIVEFTRNESKGAADLFNLTGRKRSMKLDCMIAASALLAGARLATSNTGDFLPFVTCGLQVEAV